MGYLQVYIRTGYKLHTKDKNLCIDKYLGEETISIPIEDISCILIEDNRTIITSKLITTLSNSGVHIILCDDSYTPNTIIMPYNTNYNMLGVYKKQSDFLQLSKNKLWQKIVRKKIENQRTVLFKTTGNKEMHDKLYEIEKAVKPADKENNEGYAAKLYFQALFGNGFIRFSNENISLALNYGYTILTSTVIKFLTLYGFTTFLGIWHNSEKNNFNLASDLVECFRPIVDYFCFFKQDCFNYPLSTQNRKELINLLNQNVIIDGKQCSVEYAIEVMVKSYLKVIETKEIDNILLPSIISFDITDEELYE